jgi:hypothetical protein
MDLQLSHVFGWQLRAPFLPFRLAFRVPESGRSGQGVSSVKKGVGRRRSAFGANHAVSCPFSAGWRCGERLHQIYATTLWDQPL